MAIQQIIALAIVAVAAAYLGRRYYRTWVDWRRGRAGCAKCGFAAPISGTPSSVPHHRRRNQIPLTQAQRSEPQD